MTITSTATALDGRYDLTQDAATSFRRDGHVLLREVATPDEADRFRTPIRTATELATAHLPPLEARDTYGMAFLQVCNLWQRDPRVASMVLSPRFGAIAAALLGVDRVRLYHDQALFKEPGGGLTPWHQDAMYWPLDGARCLTMWMPLVDITPDMGGLLFASGTHADGPLSDIRISDASERHFDDYLTREQTPIREPVAMRAGDATFHSGWTVHKALPNTSATTREVMTVIWFADGEHVREPSNDAQRGDLALWLPGLRAGEPAASPLNPVLGDEVER